MSETTTIAVPKQTALKPPVGLLMSIGDTTTSRGGKEIPTKIDHFRAKPGQLNQYSQAAAKFAEVYGDKPHAIDDIYFLSNEVGEVLDIRLLCWGTSGLRGVGATNYAAISDETEFLERVWSFDDDFLFFPNDENEVRPEMREDWQGEPIPGHLDGPEDPRIDKLKIKVTATLYGCLPRVMGVGTVAQISSSGKRTVRNLYKGVWSQHNYFLGQLVGIPFKLAVVPYRGRRVDVVERNGRKIKAKVPYEAYALELSTPLTIGEIHSLIRERREALGGGFQAALGMAALQALPAGSMDMDLPGREPTLTRDEPRADRPDDALLNRIAMLEREYGASTTPLLRGAWNVETAEQLTAAQAVAYETALTRLVESEVEDAGPAEVVDAEAQAIPFGEDA